MTRIVIHVGVHKTGTSALQGVLAKNSGKLAERGVWYSVPPGATNHSAFAQAFLMSRRDGAELTFKKLLNEAEGAGCDTLLLSSEVFSEHPFDIDLFREMISPHDVQIIAYIRRPDELVVSAHNELVRDHRTRWTTRIAERRPYDPTYRAILSRWVGDQPWTFVIAPYHASQWAGETLFTDFLSTAGICADGLDFSTAPRESNRSLPPSLTEVLRVANKVPMSNEERAKYIEDLFCIWDENPELFSGGDSLTLEQRQTYCALLQNHLELWRPYFRKGFKEDFLKLRIT